VVELVLRWEAICDANVTNVDTAATWNREEVKCRRSEADSAAVEAVIVAVAVVLAAAEAAVRHQWAVGVSEEVLQVVVEAVEEQAEEE